MMDLKPSRGHNPNVGPSTCLCPEQCAEKALALRCPVTDADGNQCGDYRGHRSKDHTLLVCTTFEIAAARLAERESR